MIIVRTLHPKVPQGGGGLNTQNGRFSSKIALRLKKVCYKVSLCENRQRQSCRAFIGQLYPCKYDWWGPEILGQTDCVAYGLSVGTDLDDLECP